jgi:hypothetical protein
MFTRQLIILTASEYLQTRHPGSSSVKYEENILLTGETCKIQLQIQIQLGFIFFLAMNSHKQYITIHG